jgi:hypothetical protein
MSPFEKLKRTMVRRSQRQAKLSGYAIPDSMIYGPAIRVVFAPSIGRTIFTI